MSFKFKTSTPSIPSTRSTSSPSHQFSVPTPKLLIFFIPQLRGIESNPLYIRLLRASLKGWLPWKTPAEFGPQVGPQPRSFVSPIFLAVAILFLSGLSSLRSRNLMLSDQLLGMYHELYFAFFFFSMLFSCRVITLGLFRSPALVFLRNGAASHWGAHLFLTHLSPCEYDRAIFAYEMTSGARSIALFWAIILLLSIPVLGSENAILFPDGAPPFLKSYGRMFFLSFAASIEVMSVFAFSVVLGLQNPQALVTGGVPSRLQHDISEIIALIIIHLPGLILAWLFLSTYFNNLDPLVVIFPNHYSLRPISETMVDPWPPCIFAAFLFVLPTALLSIAAVRSYIKSSGDHLGRAFLEVIRK